MLEREERPEGGCEEEVVMERVWGVGGGNYSNSDGGGGGLGWQL